MQFFTFLSHSFFHHANLTPSTSERGYVKGACDRFAEYRAKYENLMYKPQKHETRGPAGHLYCVKRRRGQLASFFSFRKLRAVNLYILSDCVYIFFNILRAL